MHDDALAFLRRARASSGRFRPRIREKALLRQQGAELRRGRARRSEGGRGAAGQSSGGREQNKTKQNKTQTRQERASASRQRADRQTGRRGAAGPRHLTWADVSRGAPPPRRSLRPAGWAEPQAAAARTRLRAQGRRAGGAAPERRRAARRGARTEVARVAAPRAKRALAAGLLPQAGPRGDAVDSPQDLRLVLDGNALLHDARVLRNLRARRGASGGSCE